MGGTTGEAAYKAAAVIEAAWQPSRPTPSAPLPGKSAGVCGHLPPAQLVCPTAAARPRRAPLGGGRAEGGRSVGPRLQGVNG